VAKNKTSRSEPVSAPLTVSRPELLSGGRDDSFRKLVHDCLAFSARLLAIRDGFAAYIGLSGPQYTLLVSIGHLQDHGDVGITALANHLSFSGTFVTTEVNKLVTAGLVRKEPHPQDGRRVTLALTNAGRAKLTSLAQVQSVVNDEHFGALSRADFDALCVIMPNLVESTERGLSLLRHLTRTTG
jgi:MarR family transcriptional regulator, organic hydroperoxide resistance regulator